ncbi:MAG: class I SAM-dependent methyltransferase [Myxococcota bacterium]
MSTSVAPSSNQLKHTTGNPIVRGLLDRFHDAVRREVEAIGPARTLDVGCGEGFVLQALGGAAGELHACDLSPTAVEACRAAVPGVEARVASAVDLPYDDDAFDVVICLEVLEHLDEPHVAVEELARVSRGHLVLSVPWEPWFQLGNLARGKYLSGWGNHPEHVQRWSPGGFRRMLQATGAVGDVRLRTSFPWTIAVTTPSS